MKGGKRAKRKAGNESSSQREGTESHEQRVKGRRERKDMRVEAEGSSVGTQESDDRRHE